MRQSGEKGVSIPGQIDPRCRRLQVQDRTDERGILMGKAVVFLSRPGAGLDIINAADIFTPVGLSGHLVEFAVLDYHGMDYTEKTLVRREEACPSGQGVTLKKALIMLDGLLPVDKGEAYLHSVLATSCALVHRRPLRSRKSYGRLSTTHLNISTTRPPWALENSSR